MNRPCTKAQSPPPYIRRQMRVESIYTEQRKEWFSLPGVAGGARPWPPWNKASKAAERGRTVCSANTNHKASLGDSLTSYTFARTGSAVSSRSPRPSSPDAPVAAERPSRFPPLPLCTPFQVPSFLEHSESSGALDPCHHVRRFCYDQMIGQRPDVAQRRRLL